MVRPRRIFAALYDRQLRPLERGWLDQRRGALLGELTGQVLEVGAGTGGNLAHYRHAGKVVACEPDPAMRARLAGKLADAPVPVQLCDAAAEALPFADQSFDVVVCTLVLCTVPDPPAALAESYRVLRPGGRLAFLEHVRGRGRLARWQDRLTPLQVWFAGGCHPNRDTQAAIADAGFAVGPLEVFEPTPNSPITRPFIQGAATRPPGGRTH
jgi:ubiquinone/menaquinone biosynthesis C-methylase UbiE